MHPILFAVGRFVVPSHEAMIGLGVCAAAAVFWAEARRRGVAGDERLLWVVAGLFVVYFAIAPIEDLLGVS